ncbi:hypothetical protein RAS1_18960 [Phycisphaerae bacterium RAS1]|nr:hypothetical protein RAS1_18960 [Phycisphaerae bacterium RAS1]
MTESGIQSRGSGRATGRGSSAGLVFVLLLAGGVRAAEPAVTVLADFEDDSVAASIGATHDIAVADCAARFDAIPARGQRCLAIELGATRPGVWAAADLVFRDPMRFEQADRVAAWCWVTEDGASTAFRLRDAGGQIFETAVQPIIGRDRWIRIACDLDPGKLTRVSGSQPLKWPLQAVGLRAAVSKQGKQVVWIDDLQIEHRVSRNELVRGTFLFNERTRIYDVGAVVGAAIELENRSQSQALPLNVEVAWTRPDGALLKAQPASLNLPASGKEYRARQRVDFSQKIDQPGLYRLVAQVRAPGWDAPSVLESTIAVFPSNRNLPRGRSTLLGVRSNLLREAAADRMLEIEVAKAIGANLLAIDVPWPLIEPKPQQFDFKQLDPLIEALVARNIVPLLSITDSSPLPPTKPDFATIVARLGPLLEACVQHFGRRVSFYQLPCALGDDAKAQEQALADLQQRAAKLQPEVRLLHSLIRAPLRPEDSTRCVQTCGDPVAAAAALLSAKPTWKPDDWWEHQSDPRRAAGQFGDVEAVFHYYLLALKAGVASAIWNDLRDDDNDPTRPELLRGLVRRDFSPKAALMGYASAATTLTGVRFAGAAPGTPPQFDSAVLIASDRQTAVLTPKALGTLPAVVAPLKGVEGQLSARDVERRPLPPIESAGPLLLPTSPRTMLVTLTLASAQPEIQVAFATPWLNVPATVFCGVPTTAEITAPFKLKQSYAQVVLPRGSPLTSATGAKAIAAEAGGTVQVPLSFTSESPDDFDPVAVTLRVSLEQKAVEIPITVERLVPLRPIAGSEQLFSADRRVGTLQRPTDRRGGSDADLFVGYQADKLLIGVQVADDRLMDAASAAAIESADQLLLGVGTEAGEFFESRLAGSSGEKCLVVPLVNSPSEAQRWSAKIEAGSGKRRFGVSLALPGLKSGTRVRMAAAYLDLDDAAAEPVISRWGQQPGIGLFDRYRWLAAVER